VEARASDSKARSTAALDDGERELQPVGLLRLGLALLWLGCISLGGRSANFVLEDLVRRRRWLRIEDYFEGHSLARILPGSTGLSTTTFLLQRMRGTGAAGLCLFLHILPGAIAALILTLLVFGTERPGWLNGGLRGFSVAALGMIWATALSNLRVARTGRLGPLFTALAFLAYGLLGIDLLLVFALVGSIALVVNRPREVRADA